MAAWKLRLKVRAEDLLVFLEALAEGPAGSVVRKVRPEWLPASGEEFGFRVRIYD
jgi:hypothetical protein